MKVTYTKADLENNPVARETLIKIMSDSKHGGFMRIHGFKSKTGHGEIQDTTYCKGISYPNAIKKSLAILDELEKDADLKVTVTRGVWMDADSQISPTSRKSKQYWISGTVTESYGTDSPELIDALAKIRKGLENPRPSKEYKKLGNGIYVDETNDTLYVRDLRVVKKTVIVHGDYPFKAKGAVSAIKDELERDMPVGNYRMFRMDAEYDNITMGGNELNIADEVMTGKSAQEKSKQDATTTTTNATANVTD
jgi:hypothetical protein